MERFVPKFQGRPWPDGARALHVYALPDLDSDRELARLADTCREAMRAFPISVLADGLLHSTVEMIADTTADRISAAERDELTAALREQLAGTGPLLVTAGSPIANRFGAFLDLHPDEGLVALRERVRETVRAVRGPTALQHDGGRPHMSLGYARGEGDSDRLQTALRQISPSHAPLHVANLHVVDVRFRELPCGDGETGWDISWEPVAVIPLAS
ncbi:2'-5' RNA ligase family protein [Kitasatospora sp. NPDC057223]|uniref:2'-5' RNA ligase family protein n=1 Tax=Kitasatospora sp. NPDC057223 TaxID=3346055 RepID=UPI00362FDE9A